MTTDNKAPIIDWRKYKEVVGGYGGHGVAFRGQAADNWKLVPSLFRVAPTLPLAKYRREILPEVLHFISPFLHRRYDLENFDDLCSFLAILQHHGFPTPLLDWTYSPYFAAFFAFSSMNPQTPSRDHIEIFIFEAAAWNQKFPAGPGFSWEHPYTAVVRPLAESNARLLAQQALFTLTSARTVDTPIRMHEREFHNPVLHSVRLPVGDCPKALRDLDRMGINDQSMFPGIEGTCRSLVKRMFFPDRVGKSGEALFRALFKGEFLQGPEPGTVTPGESH